MKRLLLYCSIMLGTSAAMAQVPSVHENFDAACGASSAMPPNWTVYNPLGPVTDGKWTCTSNGRDVTPGTICTGYYSSVRHLDTSYLITPLLNLATYAGGHVYMRFDSKVSNINMGGRLSVMIADTSRASYTDLSDAMHLTPLFTNADSSGWVTHQVDLTAYTNGAYYFAFRYTSTTGDANTWYLDNINTTTSPLNVATVTKGQLPLTIVGNNTASDISIQYNLADPGPYQLALYDIVGRQVYANNMIVQNNTGIYTITGLSLHRGMYFVHMGDGNCYGVVKVIVN